jgi:hypothetical protein
MAVWPASLPQRFLESPGVEEEAPDVMIETEMDAGPPKARRRFTAGFRMIRGTVRISKAQRATLDTFWVTTLEGGTLPFDWIHPITLATASFRFVRRGLKYRQSYSDGVDVLYADLELRLMP